ncbi:MAG: hydrogenase maturation protease [Gammaproteobacteria bacterium]|nr:hydrogenase maturation protease [Gammaproteobacteria bacterium]
MSTPGSILVIGYGNPARGDDGLGPAFIEWLEKAEIPGIDSRIHYQLCVEDAIDIASYQQVVFVDASLEGQSSFEFFPLTEQAVRQLDTHSVSPGGLMYLARMLFGATAGASVLAIRGYCFDPFVETLSDQARENLQGAIHFFFCRYVGEG